MEHIVWLTGIAAVGALLVAFSEAFFAFVLSGF